MWLDGLWRHTCNELDNGFNMECQTTEYKELYKPINLCYCKMKPSNVPGVELKDTAVEKGRKKTCFSLAYSSNKLELYSFNLTWTANNIIHASIKSVTEKELSKLNWIQNVTERLTGDGQTKSTYYFSVGMYYSYSSKHYLRFHSHNSSVALLSFALFTIGDPLWPFHSLYSRVVMAVILQFLQNELHGCVNCP